MELWELVARESVRDLIARYNANGDSGRLEQMLEVFAPDAVFETLDLRFDGKQAIHDFFTDVTRQAAGPQERIRDTPSVTDWKARGNRPMLRHITGTTQIDVIDEHTVKARSYYYVLTPHGLDHWGRYLDEFGLVDGEWKITHRKEHTDAAFEGGWGHQSAGDALADVVTHPINWAPPRDEHGGSSHRAG